MGGKKNFDISAKNFRDPLLASLGSLTGLEANKPVPFKDTWKPVCNTLGISMSDYGEVEPGKTWVQQWIGWAFRTLRNEGLGEMASKGQWMLTEAGVQAAQGMGAVAAPVAAPETDTTPEPIPAAQETDSMATEPEPAIMGVSLAVSMGNSVATYHPDPYIRALASSKTKCYGLYSPRATKTCNNCGLAGGCQNMTAMSMAILATTMGVEDAAAEAAKAAPKPAPAAAPAPVAAAAPAPTGGFDNTGAEPIMAHVKSTCYRCGKPIETGANCYWLRPSGGKKGGLFHQECF